MAGCSYSAGTSDIQSAVEGPTVWPHFFVSKIKTDELINLSIPGSGNISIGNNLIFYIENRWVDVKDHLIVFNLTELDRFDVMCEPLHTDASQYFSWAAPLGHNWIIDGGFHNPSKTFGNSLQKNMGYHSVVRMNSLAIVSTLNYLRSKKLKYRFFMLRDYFNHPDTPEFLKKSLYDHNENLIELSGHRGVFDFCKNHNMLDEDQFHPNREAHQLLAEKIARVV